MKKYKIFIETDVLSTLPKKQLEERLIVALYEIENDRVICDGENDNLTVLDYIETNADEM